MQVCADVTGCESVDILSAQVLQGFGVAAKKIKKDKSSFVLTTELGSLTIKKSLDSTAKVTFAHEIKEHLAANGFTHTDRFKVALSGRPYVENDGGVYVCTKTLSLRETNFSDVQDVLRAVESVARMHRLSLGVGSGSRFRRDNAFGQLQKDVADMVAIKRRLGTSGSLSDFDVIFLKNYDFYLWQMKETLAELQATRFEKYMEAALIQSSVIHNRLKEETLLTDGDGTYVVNFGAAEIGYGVFDLVSMIARYVRENPNEPQLSVYNLFEAYDTHLALRAEDIRIARALLRFPFRFVKLLRTYYNKKRTWTPSAIFSKMESIVEARDSYYSQLE